MIEQNNIVLGPEVKLEKKGENEESNSIPIKARY